MSFLRKNIAMAPWAGIITTNYDELLEYGIILVLPI
jgi:hypothetical protein